MDPNNVSATLLLGRMYVLQQKAADGIPLLQKAALRPLRSIHIDAYAQLGQDDKAGAERSEAEHVQSQGGSRLGTPAEDSNSQLR